jgi:hypothetical protein
VARNAFTLIIEALRIWAWKSSIFREWEILSIGEKHPDIDIGNGITIQSIPKIKVA